MTKYQRLADEIKTAIVNGGLTPGMRLPSVRELMQQHQLSLATVMSALRMLEEQDLVEPREKSGYFVKNHEHHILPSVDPDNFRQSTSELNQWGLSEDLFPEKRWQNLMLDTIRRNPGLLTRYQGGKGNLRLRSELASCSAANGCFLKEDELVITQGATEGLLLSLRAVTNPGEKVLVQSPMGSLFARLLDMLNLQPEFLHQRVDSEQFINEIEASIDKPGSPRVLLLIVNFHYPNGAVMPLVNKRKLLRLADKHELVIIEDDVYGDLQHEGPRPLTLKSYDLSGRIMYVNSCSKSMAPGLRIGWLAAGRWMDRICYLKAASSSGVNVISQITLTEYLARGSHLPNLRKLRHKLKSRKEDYLSAIRPALADALDIEDMGGGFCYWLPTPEHIETSALQQEIFSRWPVLVENSPPHIDILAQGICINTSVELTVDSRQALLKLCIFLRDLYQTKH